MGTAAEVVAARDRELEAQALETRYLALWKARELKSAPMEDRVAIVEKSGLVPTAIDVDDELDKARLARERAAEDLESKKITAKAAREAVEASAAKLKELRAAVLEAQRAVPLAHLNSDNANTMVKRAEDALSSARIDEKRLEAKLEALMGGPCVARTDEPTAEDMVATEAAPPGAPDAYAAPTGKPGPDLRIGKPMPKPRAGIRTSYDQFGRVDEYGSR